MEIQEIISGIILFAVAGIILFIYLTIKQKRDLQKAETGEDMAHLRELVAKVLPSETDYQVVYAHWEKVEYKGRQKYTTYYCYALAFDDSRLFIIPVTFDKDDDMVAHEPILVTKDTLGIAKVSVTNDSASDRVKRVAASLSDKTGKEFVTFFVDAVNTREDRFHHVNIVQYDECRHLGRFMENMSNQVLLENEGLEEQIAEQRISRNGRIAVILGSIGIVTAFIPIISFILGIAGLIKAPKPRLTGGKPGLGLILSILALVFGVGYMIIGVMNM